MRTIADVSSFIRTNFDNNTADVFDAQIDEAEYFTRALSLDDIESSLTDVEEKIHGLAQSIIIEVTNSYLQIYHGSESGDPEVNIAWDCVYDKNMNVIEPIAKLTSKQKIIIEIIIKNCMTMFRKGRQLANKIIIRKNAFLKTAGYDESSVDTDWSSSRDYLTCRPMERIEIDIRRLERKLPDISVEEGQKLSELYKERRTRGSQSLVAEDTGMGG